MSGPLRPLVSSRLLDAVVARLAGEISRDFPGGICCVGVLKGSVVLLADLMRSLSIPSSVDFLALSAYQPGKTRVRIAKDLDLDVTDQDVLLVEDVVDTGLSAHYVLRLLAERGAHEVALCTLIDRPARRIVPVEVRYVGLEVDDEFLVGYGLDVAERFRNLPTLFVGDPATIATEELDGTAFRAYRDRAEGG